MTIQSAARTRQGQAKQGNDDAVLQDPHNGIFAVADGTTRRGDGPGAARLFLNALIDHSDDIVAAVDKARPGSHDPLRKLFSRIFEEASTTVRRANAIDGGPGTCTGTVLVVRDKKAAVAHVGNTRAYLLRAEKAYRLTRDHTLAQRMADAGQILQDAVSSRPERKTLYQAVGQDAALDVDVTLFEVQRDDRFVLVSDGVTDFIRGSELEKIHGGSANQDSFVQAAMELAGARGSLDDLSCVAVGVGAARLESDIIPKVADLVGGSPPRPNPTLRFDKGTEDRMKTRKASGRPRASGKGREFAAAGSETEQVESFRNITLFEGMTRPQILHVSGMMLPVTLHEGEILFKQGEASHRLYIVTMGRLQVQIGDRDVAELHPGTLIGEVALLDGETHSATVRAVTRSRVLGLRREDLQDLLNADPTFSVRLYHNLAKTLAERLRTTLQSIAPNT